MTILPNARAGQAGALTESFECTTHVDSDEVPLASDDGGEWDQIVGWPMC